ncbi:MAG: hypothetical protein EXS10_04090 [Phycisphaerales bacterium]|nr:hypothetical protein [Phycisphaerales bacterium]
MANDFFSNQDRARSKTGRLVALFVLGVLGTMLSFWVIAAAAISISSAEDGQVNWSQGFGDPRLFFVIVGVVSCIVLIGTLYKLSQLSAGGPAIAQMLGGVEIDPSSQSPAEQKVLNIVEEMAIASGLPVPPVYVIDTDGMNAFAAGPDPTRSVIGVTRGLIESLTRDELQGVIAHEYSHIFHGDTRINARTTAAIAGIMLVGTIGWFTFRFIGPQLMRGSRGSKKNDGAAIGIALVVAGLLIWLIGSLGVLVGRMIQAGISRQREFLADASAVQYTRNPDGIANALRKLRDGHRTEVPAAAASELNHFFFCSSLSTIFATHPPLDERIARIVAMGAQNMDSTRAASTITAPAPPPMPQGAAGFAASFASAGTLSPASIAAAHNWQERIDPGLRAGLRTAAGARAVVYAITRRSDSAKAVDALVAERDGESLPTYQAVAAAVQALNPSTRMGLVDLAAPALIAMGGDAYRAFRATLALAMRVDGAVDVYEWALSKALERQVERRLDPARRNATSSFARCTADAQLVLGIIALECHASGTANEAFATACRCVGLQAGALPTSTQRTLDALNGAVENLATIPYTDRARVLEACAMAAAHDGTVTSNEFVLTRAIADALDVPLPREFAVG